MELTAQGQSMLVERRRYLRHRMHSPAYASIGAGAGGVVVDANEGGVGIESVASLSPQSYVDLRLDLLDTRGSAVTPARVAWCGNGRVGLELLNLTGESRRQLQQWLLLNTLLAAESADKLTQAAAITPNSAATAAAPEPESAGEPAFREVAERALSGTGADGAAIALAEGEAIVCRATAGHIAPPPGTKLDTQSGISGACVRSGRWLRCDDPRLDPHVDRESCQALGVNSVLAVPIGERGDILGLIEVFSRSPYAFKEDHCSALQELAKVVAHSLRPEAAPAPLSAAAGAKLAESPEPDRQQAPAPAASADEAPPSIQPAQAAAPAAAPAGPAVTPAAAPASSTTAEQRPAPASGKGGRVVLLGLVAMLAVLGLWFALNRGGGDARSVDAAEPPSPEVTTVPPTDAVAGSATAVVSTGAELSDSLRALRRHAEAGDAEAAFEVGARYASGEDVPEDYGQAVKWFTRAADHGQVLAAATLGAYYWAGRGVPQDDVSAYMWSAIAKDGGDEASKYRLAILRARMSSAQISEAEQHLANWRRTHGGGSLASGKLIR